ncbi:MAG: Rid family hydrolase, partial [Verrucomicrobiota bacterium]
GEIADLIGQLAGIARAYDTDLKSVVKLNLYLGKADHNKLLEAITKKISATWPAGRQPALTIIPGKLIGGGVLAGDAVILSAKKGGPIDRFERDAAMMPSDRDIIYISGRAAKGELGEATAGTMKQLFEVLKGMGSKRENVIQVKAFIRPMEKWEKVEQEIETSFAGAPLPPVVYVEWSSSSVATEIEIIAAAEGKTASKDGVSYFTPAGEKASPVYSKAARIHADEVIYIGGIVGAVAAPAKAQVKSLYSGLELISKQAGSSLRHFVKATYYVSDSEVSAALNQLRPEYYDPERPPAASKVAIPALLEKKRGLLIDMVAVPQE